MERLHQTISRSSQSSECSCSYHLNAARPRSLKPSRTRCQLHIIHHTKTARSCAPCAVKSFTQNGSVQTIVVEPSVVDRRAILALSFTWGLYPFAKCEPAQASKLGTAADNAWEALTGAPADLFFPDEFEGVWDITSTLVKVETPLGEAVLPNPAVVERAKREDLNQPLHYSVAFIRNEQGRVIHDRRYNTAKLMEAYYSNGGQSFMSNITWQPSDPNVLLLRAPGGLRITVRVTRRSADRVAPDRLDTSEFSEQVLEAAEGGQPRIKASQCFTKYKWRSSPQGTDIVATQVVSDYLTAYDGEERYLQAMGRPVALYTYRMSFMRRTADAMAQAVVATIGDARAS